MKSESPRFVMSEAESESYDLSRPPETMVEQTGDSRVTQWLLITGDRRAVSAVMLSGAFVVFLLLGVYGPHSIRQLLTTSLVATLFSAVFFSITTTVTLVLTLSQFGLSQQLADLGSFRNRMDNVMEFRSEIEDHTDIAVSPGRPTAFFQALARAVEEELETLAEVMADGNNHSGTGEIHEYIDVVREYSENEREQLDDPTFGSLDALLPVLNHDYSWKI
jgi:hypothetical protein